MRRICWRDLREYSADELRDKILFGEEWEFLRAEDKKEIMKQRGAEYPECCGLKNKGRPPWEFSSLKVNSPNTLYARPLAESIHVNACGSTVAMRIGGSVLEDNSLVEGISWDEYYKRMNYLKYKSEDNIPK